MASNELGGLLRGLIVDNNDPEKLGRVKVRVEAAYGEQPAKDLPWAWPCFPYGGAKDQGLFAVPEVGSGVYVMFQCKDGQPDATYPIWLGQWQSQNETPSQVEGSSEDAHCYKTLKTTSGHNLTFCDKEGGEFLKLEDKNGSYLLNKDGDVEVHAERDMKITAKSASGYSMTFSESEGLIRLQDQQGSYILMKDGNIEIYAKQDITIKAEKVIYLKAERIEQ